MTEYLELKWTVSRARDTYGYNVVTLRDESGNRFRANGGGYDMVGTVFGEWLMTVHADKLTTLDPGKFYGLTVRDDGTVRLDGACGLSSMRAIADAIGVTVKATLDRKGNYTGFMVGE
jgi:hypothetical protein